MASWTVLPARLGKPVNWNVTCLHENCWLNLARGSSAQTVLDSSVTGGPSPSGGVAVTVALLQYSPASASAALSLWWQKKVATWLIPISLEPPVISSHLVSVGLDSVSGTLPVLATSIAYSIVCPTWVEPSVSGL